MLIKPIIPVFKPSDSELQILFDNLQNSILHPLLVVNGINNETLSVMDGIKCSHDVEVQIIKYQVGKAEAIRVGLEWVLENTQSNIFVQLYARNKQTINEIPIMINKIANGSADMIVANRYAKQSLKEQVHRASISTFFSKIINCLTNYDLQDTACGTRVYTRELAHSFYCLRSYGYGLELEQLIIASINNKKVMEYPIESNLQAHGTNAEKLEDNFVALIAYVSDLNLNKSIRESLCYALTMIKKRNSFTVDFPTSCNIPITHFKYIGGNSVVDGYTNQRLIDGYSVQTC